MDKRKVLNSALESFEDNNDIVFSIMKDLWQPDGVLDVGEGPVEQTPPEDGEVEVDVVIEPGGPPNQPGFLGFVSPDDSEVKGLTVSSYDFWWTIRMGETEIFRLNKSGRYKFNVAPRQRFSFSIDGNRGGNRVVLSYLFTPKKPTFGPGAGGSATVAVNTVSQTIANGTRALSASARVSSSGQILNDRFLNYQWQYAEPGSNAWVDMPVDDNLDFFGSRSRLLYLRRSYTRLNFARRHRVVVSSSFYVTSPVISQEVPGLGSPIFELPSRPQIISVNPDGSTVTVSWTPPAFDGFSPISEYLVEYAIYNPFLPLNWTRFNQQSPVSSSSSSSLPTTATSVEITGLAAGEEYVFRVAAVNALGQGPYSIVTPNIPPAAPTALGGSALGIGGNQVFIDLVWNAPPDNGGSQVSNYSLQYSTDGGANWTGTGGAISTTTMRFWVPFSGATYLFRVAAVNSAGLGSWSGTHQVQVPAGTTPGLPRNLSISQALRSVHLSWSQPLSLGNDYSNGFLLLEYKVEYSSDGGVTWIEYKPFQNSLDRLFGGEGNVEGLDPAVGYLFRVSACNRIGCGGYITTPTPANPLYGPNAPANVRALRYLAVEYSGPFVIYTGIRYFIDWTVPTTDMTIQNYDVQMKEYGDWVTVSGPGVSTTRLFNITRQQQDDEILASGGLSRLFRVRANTGGGFGPWNDPPVTFSDASGLSPTAQNYSISNLQSNPPSRTITISWTPPAASLPGFTLQGYEVFLTEYNDYNDPSGSTTVTAHNSATSLSFPDTSGRRRGFVVLAVYTNGVKTIGANFVSTSIPAVN